MPTDTPALTAEPAWMCKRCDWRGDTPETAQCARPLGRAPWPDSLYGYKAPCCPNCGSYFSESEIARAVLLRSIGGPTREEAADLLADLLERQKAEIERLSREQPPTVSTQGWQDISTAPKGERVLLISDDGVFIGDWGNYCIYNSPKITHWIPLPAKPGEHLAPQPDLSTLTRERDQAREALAFYANQDNWNEDGQCFAGRVPVPMWASDDHGDTFIDGHLDLGATARSVLHPEKEDNS